MKNNLSLRNVSLARALSKLGFASRAQSERIIRNDRVRVNGKVISNPAFRCSLSSDIISVDDKRIKKERFIYIIMNKPVGVITTRSDEKGRHTVYDILGNVCNWVFPVGRLDRDTSGLLLLTNDNRLGELLTNPETKIPKTYHVAIDKPIDKKHMEIMQSGMKLNGNELLPAKINMLCDNEIDITIVEGKNRQVRRMFEAFEYRVKSLSRLKIGKLGLKNLKPGEWKFLNEIEVGLLSQRKVF